VSRIEVRSGDEVLVDEVRKAAWIGPLETNELIEGKRARRGEIDCPAAGETTQLGIDGDRRLPCRKA